MIEISHLLQVFDAGQRIDE